MWKFLINMIIKTMLITKAIKVTRAAKIAKIVVPYTIDKIH